MQREVLKDKAREIPVALNPASLSTEAKTMFQKKGMLELDLKKASRPNQNSLGARPAAEAA